MIMTIKKYELGAFYYLFILSMLSCSANYNLSEEDLMFNPYKAGDFFVFSNSHGSIDTFFVERVQRYGAEVAPLDVIPKYYEVLEVVIRYPVSTQSNGERKYDSDVFFDLSAAKNDHALIGLRFKSDGAKFYSAKGYSKFLFKEGHLLTLKTNMYIYNDVLKIEPSDKEYEYKSDFITAIYWSKSKGYVRYDLKNGTYFELQ